jgi:endonuclease YncB( thermonuclease family)
MNSSKNCKSSARAKALILAACIALPCHAAQLTGKVVGISDGDTLTLLDSANVQHKIRLAGIDAPEKKQPFGEKSKRALSDCAYDKPAVIEYEKKDRYGRTVGKVLVDGKDCNMRQISLGMAWHYKKYAGEQPAADRETYASLEQSARMQKRGLWAEQTAMAPWEFRKKSH